MEMVMEIEAIFNILSDVVLDIWRAY